MSSAYIAMLTQLAYQCKLERVGVQEFTLEGPRKSLVGGSIQHHQDYTRNEVLGKKPFSIPYPDVDFNPTAGQSFTNGICSSPSFRSLPSSQLKGYNRTTWMGLVMAVGLRSTSGH